MFNAQLPTLIVFILPKVSCVLSLCIQLIKSEDKNISKKGSEYFSRITTVFQQVLKIEIEEKDHQYRLEEGVLKQFSE